MERRFGRRGAVGEEVYRSRRVRGATYFRSRQEHQDLTIVVQRFPARSARVGRTYLLVHGIGVSSRYFGPLAAELARAGRVFLVDLPGYGAAPNPRRSVGLADHAAVLAGFLRETRIANPVIVGHSMGSQVVAILAEQHPDVTDRIVLMAPTMQPDSRTPGAALRNLLRDALREPLAVFWIAATDYFVRCGLPYLIRQLPIMLEDRLEERISALRARLLVVNGDRDPIVAEEWARRLARLAPDADFHEVSGPHVIMHTDPAMVAGHIVEFAETP